MWLDNETRRERYARLLSMKMQELRRKPTFAEMKNDSRMPSPNDYAFYWRSFDEAVEEIWSKVRRQFAEEGGDFMAKTQKEWPHAANELLDLAVAKCVEVGRMPSRRAWMRDQYLDFEEIVAVLGKGDWGRAELKIALAWDLQKRKTEEKVAEKTAESPALPKEEVVEAAEQREVQEQMEKIEEQVKTVEEPTQESAKVAEEQSVAQEAPTKVTGRRGKRYSREELKIGMVKVQDYFGITTIPTQGQINQAAREIGTPCYTAFLRGFGPKSDWETVMAAEEKPETVEAPKAEEPLEPEETLEEEAPVEELEETPEKVSGEEVPVVEPKKASDEENVTKEASAPETLEMPEQELVICAAQFVVIWNGQKMRLKVKFGKE